MEIQEPVSCEQLKSIFSIRSSLSRHKEASMWFDIPKEKMQNQIAFESKDLETNTVIYLGISLE